MTDVAQMPWKMWICGCVKRDRRGRMIHIKYWRLDVKKCNRCGAKQTPQQIVDMNEDRAQLGPEGR